MRKTIDALQDELRIDHELFDDNASQGTSAGQWRPIDMPLNNGVRRTN